MNNRKIHVSFQKLVLTLNLIGAMVLRLTIGGLAQAEPLPKEAMLPLALAQKAAAEALAKCEEGGYKVSVAVADRGGNLKVLLRGDGAGPHTTDSSFRKAYTAASLRRSTLHLAELIAKVPSIQALRDMNDKILILGGGLPIELEGEVVGGIGVGGAPGGHLDEACAAAGLASLGKLQAPSPENAK
ncbi:MAG: heme-binding protein [Nitrospira sp.]|nr:heme-binding protein [Nitrospira sp.]